MKKSFLKNSLLATEMIVSRLKGGISSNDKVNKEISNLSSELEKKLKFFLMQLLKLE